MASSAGTTGSRLSVNDWVQEGFRVLAEDGVKSLTLGHLCTRLGVTKGSFYWHFSDMTAYRTALIDTWAVLRDEDRSCDELVSLPPRERLSRMMSALVGPRHWMLERAMREWARSEPTVAAAVRTSDHNVMSAVRQAFLDAGFDQEAAEMRAAVTFAAGIGFLHLSGSRPSPLGAGHSEQFLEVMLRH